jgi:hypothetical protein
MRSQLSRRIEPGVRIGATKSSLGRPPRFAPPRARRQNHGRQAPVGTVARAKRPRIARSCGLVEARLEAKRNKCTPTLVRRKTYRIRCVKRNLVGAVGIENNRVRNLKDLREMRSNTKSLKRNDEERKAILIAPSKLPRSHGYSIPFLLNFSPWQRPQSRLRAQISRHGWRADNNSGKLMCARSERNQSDSRGICLSLES